MTSRKFVSMQLIYCKALLFPSPTWDITPKQCSITLATIARCTDIPQHFCELDHLNNLVCCFTAVTGMGMMPYNR